MKNNNPVRGYCWYIKPKNAEFHHYLLWELAETKNLSEERLPDNTGKRISVLRVGDLGQLYRIREVLRHRYINKRYYCYTSVITIFVRRSPRGQLQPWPTPHKGKKA